MVGIETAVDIIMIIIAGPASDTIAIINHLTQVAADHATLKARQITTKDDQAVIAIAMDTNAPHPTIMLSHIITADIARTTNQTRPIPRFYSSLAMPS